MKKPEKEKPADLHQCTWACPILCALGHHTRLKLDGLCRCCRRQDHQSELMRARGEDWTGLTTKWWR